MIHDRDTFITAVKTTKPLTPRDAATFLGMDEKTITRWCRKGYLPAHPLGEGKRKFWRIFENELLAFLAAQSNGACPA